MSDKPKNPAAVELGRLGGKAKGKPKGFAAATPEQRAAWGRLGGLKRGKAKPLRPPLLKKDVESGKP